MRSPGPKLSNRQNASFLYRTPHIGPYVSKLYCGNILAIVFGARQPEDASIRIPELDRADIVAACPRWQTTPAAHPANDC